MKKDDDNDKDNIWKILLDPDYVFFIPMYKKIVADISERKKQEKERIADKMKKLIEKLGKNDD